MRVILSIVTCLLFCLNVSAQNGQGNLDPRVALNSKTQEYSAHASRNSLPAVSATYKDIKVLLEDFLKEMQTKIKNTPEPQKSILKQKLKQQQDLYANINSLYNANPLQNAGQIDADLQSFMRTLY